jgi:serine/threonine protein phosphatase PrpC
MFSVKTNVLPITLCAKTDIGKRRDTNEDSVSSMTIDTLSFKGELNCGILVVADGMGGREKGEVASDIASKKFIEEIVESLFHLSKFENNINYEQILRNAIDVANREIWKISDSKSKPIGSTIVGAIIVDNHIFIGNVGDLFRI